MNKPKLWTALFAALLLCAGCKDFFHPEGPTKAPPPPLTDEQAAEAFREIETVKEALEINIVAIDLDVPAEDLVDLEATIDEALAAYDDLSEGARSALSAEKAKLDAVKEKIGHVYQAHVFRDDHTVILSRLPGELETAEEAAVLLPELEAALEAIGALSEGAQELLAEDGDLLESLKEKVEELTAPPVQHTITFDSHGGSEVPPVMEDEGTAVPRPGDPTLDGHSFLGWFDTETGGALYAWPHTLTESITIHAQWQEDSLPPPTQYTIYFDTHNGSEPSSETANEGTAVNKPADPAMTGYAFAGWFNAASGGIEHSVWPHVLTGDVTMHAQWTAISYTVQYNANGGTGTMAPSAHTYDTAKNLTANGFARNGYSFKEWAAEPGGDGAVYANEASVTNLSASAGAVVNLYAQWTAISYTVQYNPNGGTGTMAPSAHTYDAAKNLTDNGFVRNGYTFKEWAAAPNGSGAVYADGASVVNLSSTNGVVVNLYAQWTAINYVIVYELYEGTNHADNPPTYTIESPAITLLDPTHAAREFQDWYTDPGFDQADLITEIPAASTGPKTFYARWRPLAPIETTLLQPAADPALAEQVVFEGSTAAFTAAGDYADHAWYWDGELESGQTGPTYTLTGEEAAGIHELSVVVSGEGGKPLSARCKVTIKAKAN